MENSLQAQALHINQLDIIRVIRVMRFSRVFRITRVIRVINGIFCSSLHAPSNRDLALAPAGKAKKNSEPIPSY